ncbi:MAG TPA: hypothetical protein VJ799_13000 [Nitrososphaeraceae archaeon]|nr:hypothetical protein [Nitrososphaeraceae archaeon]
MNESNKGKKIVSRSSEYNPVTHETKYTITYTDGSSDRGTFSNGKTLSGAVTAATSSNSPKMKRQNIDTEEDSKNKS